MNIQDRAESWSALRGLSGPMAALLRPMLRRIHVGGLTLRLPDGGALSQHGSSAGPEAFVEIHRWRAVRRLLLGGDIGFAESYMDGDWSTPDLTAVIELAARNSATLYPAIGASAPMRALNRLRHLARTNTRRGSRRNIEAHYDLGNAFYGQWLDESMTYSSAIYTRGVESLEDAQAAKIARVCELLDPKPGHSVLEIGCGWGALANAIASRTGAHVTGLTLSPSQLAFARESAARQGLQDMVDLRIEDYRDARGLYDRIVSIEMIEAVGERYWPHYFGAIRDRLARGGEAVLQVITISDHLYDDYSRAADFIQRYIFPGGMLPSKAVLRDNASRAGLEIISSETFGDSYALTLAEWRRRFQLAWPTISEMGFDARFRKLWEYYLCYCEAGFRAGTIDVGLYRMRHAGA